MLGGFMGMLVAVLAHTALVPAVSNGSGQQSVALAQTESMYVGTTALAALYFLRYGIAGAMAMFGGGTMIDRGLGAGIYLVGFLAAAILFHILARLLVLLLPWVFYY